MVLSVREMLGYLSSLNPTGKPGGEEGVLYGREDASFSSILVTWMPTVAALEHAVSENCQLIVCHEALSFHDYFPYASSPELWTADRARQSILEANDLTVVRAHSTVDPTHVVPAFIKALGLSPPARRGNVWSFHQEHPIPLKALAKRTAAGLGMQTLRVTGDPERSVTRVGTMVGGLGLDRHLVSWERHLMGCGVEVIVLGETNDFAQRFAIDSGIALIETCHSASEEPGLAVLADDLRSRFPAARVVFHKEVVPWTVL